MSEIREKADFTWVATVELILILDVPYHTLTSSLRLTFETKRFPASSIPNKTVSAAIVM
jgi:hypothetical protein